MAICSLPENGQPESHELGDWMLSLGSNPPILSTVGSMTIWSALTHAAARCIRDVEQLDQHPVSDEKLAEILSSHMQDFLQQSREQSSPENQVILSVEEEIHTEILSATIYLFRILLQD